MSVQLNVECPQKQECRYNESCTLLHKGGKNIEFTPTLKIRMIGLKLTVRCFSFKNKRIFLDED